MPIIEMVCDQCAGCKPRMASKGGWHESVPITISVRYDFNERQIWVIKQVADNLAKMSICEKKALMANSQG